MGDYIARVWHGIGCTATAAAFVQHIQTKRLSAYRAAPGNCGAFVLHRSCNGVAEFLVISFWESFDAIRVFVGSEDVNKSLYFEEDKEFLLVPEPLVRHYELANDSISLATIAGQFFSGAPAPSNDAPD